MNFSALLLKFLILLYNFARRKKQNNYGKSI